MLSRPSSSPLRLCALAVAGLGAVTIAQSVLMATADVNASAGTVRQAARTASTLTASCATSKVVPLVLPVDTRDPHVATGVDAAGQICMLSGSNSHWKDAQQVTGCYPQAMTATLAVGYYQASVSKSEACALHLVGTTWERVPVGVSSGGSLSSVSGNLAVGFSATASPLFERWSGHTFVRVPVSGVSSTSAIVTDIDHGWAVGSIGSKAAVWHWNGHAMQGSTLGTGMLYGISGTWAGGSTGKAGLMEHLANGRWRPVAIPAMSGLEVVGPNWVEGNKIQGNRETNQLLHLVDGRWRTQTAPAIYLPSAVQLAGSYMLGEEARAGGPSTMWEAHWNGSAWKVIQQLKVKG